MMMPDGAVFFESVNRNSAGFPAVTLIVVIFAELDCALAGRTHASGAHTATSASKPIRYRTICGNPLDWLCPTYPGSVKTLQATAACYVKRSAPRGAWRPPRAVWHPAAASRGRDDR